MKKTVLSQLDASMVQYFTNLGLTEKDFWCTECGKCLVDVNDLKKFKYITKQKHKDLPMKSPYLIKLDNGIATPIFAEPEEYRWLLKGKYLSETHKTVFRHICWNCFFKLLPTIVDIKRAARKSKWYKSILEGKKPIPLTNIASSDYFKLLFDITDEEIQAEKVKLATASLEKFIRKYGPEEGKKKYDTYCARQAYTCSKDYMKKTRGWTDEQWNEFNASRASTEENFIKRYGEDDGKKKWQEYCAYEAFAGNTLTYFVETYGKELGVKKYTEVCEKKMFLLKTYSNISQTLFQTIDKKLGSIGKESRWESKNFEYELYIEDENGIKRIIKVDYYLNGHIIEFNGDFWHANPRYYAENDKLPRPGLKKSLAKDIWKRDAFRKNALEHLGYKVMVVWETDYYNDTEKTISDCVAFLKS